MFSFRRAFALLPLSMTLTMVIAAPIPAEKFDTEPNVAQSHAETHKINGKDARIEKLPDFEQIPHFNTYSILGGWDGKPDQAAIARIGITKEKKLMDNIESSIEFLKKPAELLYHSEWNDKGNSEWEYVVVTMDMRKNYPKEGEPELARLHEWLNKDTTMDLAAAVNKVRDAAIKKAEEMASKDKVVFNISPYNVWTNEAHDVIYFDVYLDAYSIKDGADSEEGKKALDDMRTQAKKDYTEDSVRKALDEGTAAA